MASSKPPARIDRETLIQRVNAEAHALLRVLEPLDLEPAAEHIRQHPPSPEAIVTMAFMYRELAHRASQRAAAAKPRNAVTKAAIDDYRAEFVEKHGRDRGWKAAAVLEFGVTLSTLNSRLRE